MPTLRKKLTQLLAIAAILTPLALAVTSTTPQASDWPSGSTWSPGR